MKKDFWRTSFSNSGAVSRRVLGLGVGFAGGLLGLGAMGPEGVVRLEAAAAQGEAIPPENVEFFESKIRPILANHCLECHSAEKGKVKGGFNMDTRADTLRGGENGAAIQPGDVAGSSLIKAVEWTDDLQMPPKKKLSEEQIAALKEWVKRGVPDPREGSSGPKVTKKDHWAFQPVANPKPPSVKNEGWVKNAVDRFVLAKLEEKGMLPADPPETGSDADQRRKKEALLRRAYFDLIGLPPSPKEISEFVTDPSPEAFKKVVERLLDSPAYGERWARHWMDTARYSDTTGAVNNNLKGQDYRYAYAWAYRDWLIKAINNDMPYDQFILNQLAADRIADNSPENLAAMGFLTVGQRFPSKNDIINDRIDVVGRGFLGLTVACARCHDHKFDPIKQADYYALKGIFDSVTEPKEGPVIGGDPESKEYQEFEAKKRQLEEKAYAAVYEMEQELAERFQKHAGAYFRLVYLRHQKDNEDAQKKAQALSQSAKLPPNDRFTRDHLEVRLSQKDPVLGPFLKLIQVNGNPDQSTMGEATRRPREAKALAAQPPNSEVVDFLAKAGKKLPSDLEGVATLFEKFMRERVEPLVKGGIFRKLPQTKSEISEEERAKFQIACFPISPLLAKDLSSVEKVRDLCKVWGERDGNELQSRAELSKLNELKMTAGGAQVRAMVLEDLPRAVNSPIFPRGNPPKSRESAKIVPRRFIEVLSPGGNAEPFREGSGRLELAKAIASKENPMTARVMVNRLWMYHFGEGLVRTPDDLGNQAGRPSHPELLDFLAHWFMADFGESKPAWSVKALHKAIMLSNTYQQSSRTIHLERQKEVDPNNQLLWRANVRRLDFEAVRDSMLSMSGTMDPRMYGSPVNLVSEPYSFRRSVYGYIDRGNLPDLLAQFDVAIPQEPNTKRTTTIVPQQALFLMNSPFTIGVVQKVSQRLELAEAVARDMRMGIMMVFQIVLQRSPTKEESDMAYKFIVKEAWMQKNVAAGVAKTGAAAQKRAEEQLKTVRETSKDVREEARKAVLNEGELVQRHAMSPWESLVQALMFCNEAAYLN
jgi:hypothetical protein